jgi:hypothetical protein
METIPKKIKELFKRDPLTHTKDGIKMTARDRFFYDKAKEELSLEIEKEIDGLMLNCPIQREEDCWCKPLEILKQKLLGGEDE